MVSEDWTGEKLPLAEGKGSESTEAIEKKSVNPPTTENILKEENKTRHWSEKRKEANSITKKEGTIFGQKKGNLDKKTKSFYKSTKGGYGGRGRSKFKGRYTLLKVRSTVVHGKNSLVFDTGGKDGHSKRKKVLRGRKTRTEKEKNKERKQYAPEGQKRGG